MNKNFVVFIIGIITFYKCIKSIKILRKNIQMNKYI